MGRSALAIFAAAALVMAGCEKLGASQQDVAPSSSGALAAADAPADWPERDMGAFSFKAPKALTDMPKESPEGFKGDFQSEPYAIWFDYGPDGEDRAIPEEARGSLFRGRAKIERTTIDGQPASIMIAPGKERGYSEEQVYLFIKGVRPGENLAMMSQGKAGSAAEVRRIYRTIRFNRDTPPTSNASNVQALSSEEFFRASIQHSARRKGMFRATGQLKSNIHDTVLWADGFPINIDYTSGFSRVVEIYRQEYEVKCRVESRGLVKIPGTFDGDFVLRESRRGPDSERGKYVIAFRIHSVDAAAVDSRLYRCEDRYPFNFE